MQRVTFWLLVLIGAGALGATQPALVPWEVRARDCKLHAVLECTQTGALTAEYKVLESWRGPAAGAVVRVTQSANLTGRHTPIAFVGQRFLVMAGACSLQEPWPFGRRLHCELPALWRGLRSDYWAGVGDDFKCIADDAEMQALCEPVRAHYTLTTAEREARVLKACAEDPGSGTARLVRVALQGLIQPKDVLDALRNTLAWTCPGLLRDVVARGGAEETLAWLAGQTAEIPDWGKVEREEVAYSIRLRLGLEQEPHTEDGEEERIGNRAAWLKRLKESDFTDLVYAEAFQHLVEEDPAAAADFLASLKDPPGGDYGSQAYYTLAMASHFGRTCSADREQHLTTLLQAEYAPVRVAAAVYLCFDDAKAGEAALTKMLDEPGWLGGWAALTLARRGHPELLERLITFVEAAAPGEHGLGELLHQHFQVRVLELLSNSAAFSGVAQPPVLTDGRHVDHEKAPLLRAWADTSRDKLRFHDPWAEELAALRAD